jgi:hypothetical protein
MQIELPDGLGRAASATRRSVDRRAGPMMFSHFTNSIRRHFSRKWLNWGHYQ